MLNSHGEKTKFNIKLKRQKCECDDKDKNPLTQNFLFEKEV